MSVVDVCWRKHCEFICSHALRVTAAGRCLASHVPEDNPVLGAQAHGYCWCSTRARVQSFRHIARTCHWASVDRCHRSSLFAPTPRYLFMFILMLLYLYDERSKRV